MNKQNKKNRLSRQLITPANFQETCRICFSQGNLYDTEASTYEDCTIAQIFRGLICEKELEIVESYKHILYPQYICYSCIQNLIYTKLFFNQCYKAPKTLSKVYTHLTLHQHNSIIITKPSFLYQKANTAIMGRCKLSKIALKLTMELEKAFLRRRNEVNVIKKCVDPIKSVENEFEILADEKSPEIKQIKEILNVEINKPNKKRKIDLHLDNKEMIAIKIDKSKKKTVKKFFQTDNTLALKNDEIDEELSKVLPKALTELNEINLPQKETDNTQVKETPKQKIRKSPRKKKIVSYNEQQKRPRKNKIIDCVNIQPLPKNWWCKSSNAKIYRKKVKTNKLCIDTDLLSKKIVNQNDKLAENSPIANNTANQTLKNNDYKVKNENQLNNSACAKQLDVRIDIKKEPIEQSTDKIITHELITPKKLDTGQIHRAIEDINRDQRNIDLDHCYTNMNVFKNVRHILPRLNFKRTNDLLYPAPDVARKKDRVLAGNISKRMASIMSGNLTEKPEGIEVRLEHNLKIEPIDDCAQVEECGGYIKPEYVHVDEDFMFSEEKRFIRMIQQDHLHNDNEMGLCEVDPLLQNDNLNTV